MSDARSKAIFVTFMLFICLFSFCFVKEASAATYNNVMSCPSVQADSTGAIGGLNIVESPSYSLKQGDSVSVNLSTIAVLKKIQIQETSACVNTATIELDTPTSGEFTISDLAVNVSGAIYEYGAYSYEITGVPGTCGPPRQSSSRSPLMTASA